MYREHKFLPSKKKWNVKFWSRRNRSILYLNVNSFLNQILKKRRIVCDFYWFWEKTLTFHRFRQLRKFVDESLVGRTRRGGRRGRRRIRSCRILNLGNVFFLKLIKIDPILVVLSDNLLTFHRFRCFWTKMNKMI